MAPHRSRVTSLLVTYCLRVEVAKAFGIGRHIHRALMRLDGFATNKSPKLKCSSARLLQMAQQQLISAFKLPPVADEQPSARQQQTARASRSGCAQPALDGR